jgi:hypothetical protein
MGPYAGVGYNLSLCLLKSRLQHIYYGKPHREIRLKDANPIAGVFQNIDPPPPSPPGECVSPFNAGGGHTRRVERGVGGQYFGRRQAQLCTLLM